MECNPRTAGEFAIRSIHVTSTKRFLRDKVLDGMLNDIQFIASKVLDASPKTLVFNDSIASLEEMFETNKLVLSRLEEAIAELRNHSGKDAPDIIDPLVEACAHIQIAMVSIHNSLRSDLDRIHDTVTEMRGFIENSSKCI